MFSELIKFIPKPELYAPSINSLYRALWDDEHISRGMLEAHLNPSWDAASRNHEFLDKSAKWISKIAPPSQYKQLLDLGCGPGLYAERFNNAGYSVTGIDFSKRSIEYAKEQSTLNKSNIEYLYQDYLEIEYTERFNIITLIYCDYAVFSITNRRILLRKIYQALNPNGKFIFDVFSPVMRKNVNHSWEYRGNGGFYSAKPHILLEATYQYDDEDKTELDQQIVITEDGINCYAEWNHYFDKETLITEIQDAGFTKFEFFGDVAGEEYTDTGKTICGLITK